MQSPVEVVLELARAAQPADPFAFQFAPTEYLLRSRGGGFQGVRVDWSQAWLDDLAALGRPGCPPEIVQRIGDRLRTLLEPAGWASLEATIADAVARKAPVVVTFRSAAAELYALPWELCALRGSGQHLGGLEQLLVRYEWPDTQSAPSAPFMGGTGRILFAWSTAGGAVPAAEHLTAIRGAATLGHVGLDPARDVVAHVSGARLAEALAAPGDPVTVLHVLCHGGARGDTFGLVWDGPAGENVVVSPDELRQILAPYAAQIRLVVVTACESANPGALGNHIGSVAQTLHRAGIQAIVASRFPLSVAGSTAFTETFYRELCGGTASVERALLSARAKLAQDTGRLDWASVQLYARETDGRETMPLVFRPYRGLLAFQSKHSRFFFGREAEQNEVGGRVRGALEGRAPRFQAVVGASGSGKSSLVLAGLIPDLSQSSGGSWDTAVLRPAVKLGLLAALVQALRSASGAEAGTPEGAARWTVQDVMEEARRLRAARPDRPFLVVVDQFEEVFTNAHLGGERDAFVQILWGIARTTSLRTVVLLTLRVDFLGRCGELFVDDAGQRLRLDKVLYDQAASFLVPQLGIDQLRAVIEQPAARVGLVLEQGLTDAILSDIGDDTTVLPLLEYALDELWKQRSGARMTLAAYARMGGFKGALARSAEQTLGAMTAAEQAEARRLCVRMVELAETGGLDTRRRAWLDAMRPQEDGPAFDSALTKLVQSRLIVVGDEQSLRAGAAALEASASGAGAWAEIAHETLIRTWERLRRWVSEDREMLRELGALEQACAAWMPLRGTPQRFEYVLRGRRLEAAQAFRDAHRREISPDVLAFIAESENAQQGRARLRRRGTAVAVASGAIAVGLIVTGLVVFQTRRHEARRAPRSAPNPRPSPAPPAAPTGPAPAPSASPDETLVYADTFDDDKGRWWQPPGAGERVYVDHGKLHVVASAKSTVVTYPAAAPAGDLPSFTLEVDVARVQGSDTAYAGVAWRWSPSLESYAAGTNGDAWISLVRYEPKTNTFPPLADPRKSAVVRPGSGAQNRLEVVVRGSAMTLFINGEEVSHAVDGTLSRGRFALYAGPSMHVTFSNLRLTAPRR